VREPALAPAGTPGEAVSAPAGPVARARASLLALETLEQLTTQGAAPSETDLSALRGWAGWGPMAPAFSASRKGAWREIGERLEWLLPPEQLREAEQATPNAYYTPPGLADACWQILHGLGFRRGRILEPGCGAGAFIAATPGDVAATWTGVERDPATARIAQLLHPSAQIINQRLQDAALPAHSVDAVIGNVPFGETPVYDPTAPKTVTKSLHNYCIWRSARTLRPGGVAALITSRYTMDARDAGPRSAIAAEADLIAAIRLPNNALASGGTEVVTDILVLRRHGGESPDAPDWIDTAQLCDAFPGHPWAYDDRINQWFVRHPGMVLGETRPDHAAQYGRTVQVTRPDGASPLRDALAGATASLITSAEARSLTWEPSPQQAAGVSALGVPQRTDGRKERSFHLTGGGVCQIQDGALVPVAVRGREQGELTALIRLRDAAVSLLDAEADHSRGDDSLTPLRASLNTAYDSYLARYGPLNRATIVSGEPDPETGLATLSRRRPRMGGFRQDPDYVTVLALETYDDENGQAAKAPIFAQRVNKRPRRQTRADTPAEAIRLRLDLPTLAGLLNIPAAQVPAQISGLAYLDPATGDWVTAEEYLSGNVREKLAAARAAAPQASAAAAEPGADAWRWEANITALEKIQPADLGPGEIRAKLGAPWIPATDVRAFARDLLGYSPTVTYLPVTSQWEVKIDRDLADTAAATAEWGTGRIDAYRLLELALNGRAPAVYDTIQTPEGETRVRNQTETLLAEDKQRALAARFGEWAWEDPQRCDRLSADYNRRFNSVVPRRYDGSHLTFPGMAGEFTPYPHQRDMVHRIICSPAALCPYPVGTGKTPTMFMAARKLKELGLAHKPLIIVPNHLLEQTAREGKRLFPSARILMAAREDLASAQARKLFAARCATGDWDAVVMTHSAFTAIPVHPTTEANHLTELAARYRQTLTAEPNAGKRSVKQLAKMIDAFETRARQLLDHRTDDGVFFEHLGADFIMVDESHYFKNLGIPVRTDGFSISASKRATDLDMKLCWLRQRGGRTGALFTGTPVSNSLLEMYVLQHYLQPGRLEELGLHSADAWAATFVEFQTGVEVTPDGSGFRMKRRPAKFENVPELLTLFGEVADLRPPDSFALERPAARHHTVVIPSSAELRAYVASLAERVDRLRQVDPRTDNMLKICSDGRKAALDLDLVGVASSSLAKADAVISKVARVYHANRHLALPGDGPGDPRGGFQIVFCDLGTPDAVAGSQVYGKIRDGLIRAGVPARQIRFIHDAATNPQKAALFADCRAGKVAVLLGSTDKLGVGTNIQSRCVALHHVDAPWRPADVEQREGRAVRPGNLNASVEVFRYVSEKSFDSFMWQALERKARFIGQVLGGRPTGRDVDDIGDATLSYAEVKALATGNPLLLELAEANAAVMRLRQLATAHTRASRRLASTVGAWEQQITAKTRLAEECDRIARTARDHPDPAWLDSLRNLIPADDVAAHLARLTGQALTSACYETVSWRGLRVSFTTERAWRQIQPVATISAYPASLRAELNPAWTAKGQHWRIEKELTARIDGAVAEAERLRGEIGDLRQRVTDATRRIGEPFPQAAELEAARARRDAIEQQIRDAAAPQDENTDAPGAQDDHADETAHDAFGLAGLDGDHEITFFTPAALAPEAPAQDGTSQANPPLSPASAAGEVTPARADSSLLETPAGGEPGPAKLDTPGADEQPGEAPTRDAAAAAGRLSGKEDPAHAPIRHPARLTQPGWSAEPLFPVPAPAPAQAPDGHRPRTARTAARGRARRTPPQLAAQDGATQPALFDLPADPALAPGRRPPPAQNRKSKPSRK
jgi:N12 class adenine-specific DNA methylase